MIPDLQWFMREPEELKRDPIWRRIQRYVRSFPMASILDISTDLHIMKEIVWLYCREIAHEQISLDTRRNARGPKQAA